MSKQKSTSKETTGEKEGGNNSDREVQATASRAKQNSSELPNSTRAIHMDDPDAGDTLLEEEELLEWEDGKARPDPVDSKVAQDGAGEIPKPGPGKMLVPHIVPRGLTVDRIKGGRFSPGKKVEMIEVKDDRVGTLGRLARNHYLQLIMPLHVELLKLQNWVKEKKGAGGGSLRGPRCGRQGRDDQALRGTHESARLPGGGARQAD